MEKNILARKKAELTLLYAIPLISDAQANSRLSGLQRKLQKAVRPHLAQLPNFTNHDFREILSNIHEWGQDTDWWESKKSIGTVVSFCLTMIENSPIQYDKKIYKTLNELAEHLENGNALYPLSCTAGQIAQEKWERVYTKKE